MDSNTHRPSVHGCLKALGIIDTTHNGVEDGNAASTDSTSSTDTATDTVTPITIFGHCDGDLNQ